MRLTGVRGGASAASSAESFEAALAALEEASAAFAAEARITRPFWPSFVWDGPPAAASGSTGYETENEAPPAPPLPSEDLEDIARELALEGLDSEAALQRARRRFMWLNHPDRRPDWPHDLATRRVALANMLIDKALRRLRLARSPA